MNTNPKTVPETDLKTVQLTARDIELLRDLVKDLGDAADRELDFLLNKASKAPRIEIEHLERERSSCRVLQTQLERALA